MAAIPSRSTLVVLAVGAVLAGSGGAWWVDARPVEPAPVATPEEPPGLSPFARIVVVNEADGSVAYDERQPTTTAERLVSAELPCGSWQTDGRTFQQRIWAARQASTQGSLCWLVRERPGR